MVAANKSKKSVPGPPTMEEVPPRPSATAKAQPPMNLRRDSTAEQSDKEFLRREESKDRNRSRATADYSDPGTRPAAPPPSSGPGVINPPAYLDAPSADFPVLFARTPFAGAPPTV